MSYVAAEGFVESYQNAARISPMIHGEYKVGGPDKLVIAGIVSADNLFGALDASYIKISMTNSVLVTPPVGPVTWQKISPNYIEAGPNNTCITTIAGAANWTKVAPAMINAGANNTVLSTDETGTVAWKQVVPAAITPGAANTVLITDPSSVVKWGKLPVTSITPSATDGQILATSAGVTSWVDTAFVGFLTTKIVPNMTINTSFSDVTNTTDVLSSPAYNSTTGIHTALIAGVYVFTVDIYHTNTANLTNSVVIALANASNTSYVNGSSYKVTPASGEFVQIVNVVYTMYQTVGQTVKVRVTSQPSGTQSYTYRFAGYLIQ